MIKAKPWNGKDLQGDWEFTIKIDGVRALWWKDESYEGCPPPQWVSRAGKPLYNMPHATALKSTVMDAEVYCGSFKETIERVRSATKSRPIAVSHIYSLDPLDARLRDGTYINPPASFIKRELAEIIAKGFEGLVLRQGSTWLKVKPEETLDVPILSIIEGKHGGKHEGRMGAVMTPMGKVGTGFSDFERDAIWADRKAHIGVLIEVSCMQLTPDGKFRHPRFVRFRYDK